MSRSPGARLFRRLFRLLLALLYAAGWFFLFVLSHAAAGTLFGLAIGVLFSSLEFLLPNGRIALLSWIWSLVGAICGAGWGIQKGLKCLVGGIRREIVLELLGDQAAQPFQGRARSRSGTRPNGDRLSDRPFSQTIEEGSP